MTSASARRCARSRTVCRSRRRWVGSRVTRTTTTSRSHRTSPPSRAIPGSSRRSGSPSPGVGLQASFILANPAGLLALDSTGHAIGRIIDLPAQSASATPVLHPSGKAIVFALTQQPDKKTGFGSDLYTVNLDGTGFKPLVQHESDNVFYASPRFDSTGNILYFHRRAAIIQAGSFVGNEDSLERPDLRTGERKRLIVNGADPTISPTADRIVYVHLTQGQPDS